MLLSYWRLRFYKYNKQEIDAYAEAIARQGYNMVRLHYVDVLLMGMSASNPKQRKAIDAFKIPEKIKNIPFNKACVDRVDYFIYCLKKRGIYVNLDAMSSPAGFTRAYSGYSRTLKGFRLQLLVNPKYRNNWREGINYILNHVNPYTRTKLGEDPILFFSRCSAKRACHEWVIPFTILF